MLAFLALHLLVLLEFEVGRVSPDDSLGTVLVLRATLVSLLTESLIHGVGAANETASPHI